MKYLIYIKSDQGTIPLARIPLASSFTKCFTESINHRQWRFEEIKGNELISTSDCDEKLEKKVYDTTLNNISCFNVKQTSRSRVMLVRFIRRTSPTHQWTFFSKRKTIECTHLLSISLLSFYLPLFPSLFLSLNDQDFRFLLRVSSCTFEKVLVNTLEIELKTSRREIGSPLRALFCNRK